MMTKRNEKMIKKLPILLIVSAVLLLISFPSCAEETQVCATVQCGEAAESFSSFEEAWNQAVRQADSSGDVTFTMLRDWNGSASGSLGSGAGFKSGALYCSAHHNLTIDLNGCTINRNLVKPESDGAVIYVSSVLTMTDSRSGEYLSYDHFKGGAVTGGANDQRGGGIVVSGSGVLNFCGGTILNCVSTDDGGAISVEGEKAVLDVSGGSFYGNRTYSAMGECCGGAIYSSDAKVTISNAFFEDNYAEDNGGAIYADDGTLSVSGSSFYSSYSLEEGGAFYSAGDLVSRFENCTFSFNRSDEEGGAVYINSDDGTYLTDCQMDENHSSSEGGAVHVNADKVFVIGGEYRRNTASKDGGGIYVDSMYDVNIAGKLIVSGNTSGGSESDVCLQNGHFSTAYLACGGLYEGSSVYLCSTDQDSRLAVSGIDQYQFKNYIHFDEGFTAGKLEEHQISQDGLSAEGSVIGGGEAAALTGFAVLIVFACTALFFYKKRKGTKSREKGVETDAAETK